MKGGRDPPFKSSETRFPLSEAIGSVRRPCDGVLILLLFISKQCIIKQLLDSVFVISGIINKVSVSIDCEQSLVFLCKVTARET